MGYFKPLELWVYVSSGAYERRFAALISSWYHSLSIHPLSEVTMVTGITYIHINYNYAVMNNYYTCIC